MLVSFVINVLFLPPRRWLYPDFRKSNLNNEMAVEWVNDMGSWFDEWGKASQSISHSGSLKVYSESRGKPKTSYLLAIRRPFKHSFNQQRDTKYTIWIQSAAYREHDILTHWGRVTHICVNKITIIGSDNGLSPERLQAII